MSDTPNNITKLLTALITPAQDIGNAASQVFLGRSLDTAEGAQLDIIGALVGQARNGMSDTDYRRYCRARIKVHRSNGTTDELIAIAKLILNLTTVGKVFVRGVADATFTLEVRDHAVDAAVALALQQMLCAATAGGVRIVIVYSARPLVQTYRLDSGPGLDQGHMARGIDANSTVSP